VEEFLARRAGAPHPAASNGSPIRHRFDWFVTGQVVPVNPANSVRVPRHVVDRFGL
jgi:integrase/recombinase XerC